jgi:phosphate/sulfate permease
MVSLLIAVVLTALIFDFINGFHDTANAIATSVSTGVMSIRTAVVVSGVFNFVGALTGTAVASFLASGLVLDPAQVTPLVILAALLGASAWNLLTWWFGLPSSSSHALIGGLAGAVVAHAGLDAFVWRKLLDKVIVPLVTSPLIGFLLAFMVMIAAMWICRRLRPTAVTRGSRFLQLCSACTLSFAHGLNDAQKVMGIIALTMVTYLASLGLKPLLVPQEVPVAARLVQAVVPFRPATPAAETFRTQLEDYDVQLAKTGKPPCGPERTDAERYRAAIAATAMPDWMQRQRGWLMPTAHLNVDRRGNISEGTNIPLWAILCCALAMSLGTLAGGKRIIKTLGSKIIKITPLQGFAAQTSGTAVIIGMSLAGTPLSTTHCITASVLGAGASKSLAAVRWTTALNIVIAWVITLPASALMAWLVLFPLQWLFA